MTQEIVEKIKTWKALAEQPAKSWDIQLSDGTCLFGCHFIDMSDNHKINDIMKFDVKFEKP